MGAISLKTTDGTTILDAPTIEKGIENLIDTIVTEVDEEQESFSEEEKSDFFERWDTDKMEIRHFPDKTIKEVMAMAKAQTQV